MTRFARPRLVVAGGLTLLTLGLGSAWAQIAVTDPATTARNAVVAALKDRILDLVRTEQERLQSMASRLDATRLHNYALGPNPQSPAYDEALAYRDPYRQALRSGDPSGNGYADIARTRQDPTAALSELSPLARAVVTSELATLDAADSTIITSTNEAGLLRLNAQRERAAIDALQADVVDPSISQSATAVLDKISGAALIEARQKQARLQYLTAIVEQLLVDNKRARDTETGLLNMQFHRMRTSDGDEGGASMLTGAADDLRTWRQP